MALGFAIDARDGAARAGRIQLPRGEIRTPVFMPVGTRAAVKSLTAGQTKAAGASIILANAYHLALRPGVEAIEASGGLHEFMNWDGSILTDSGGFQVFSLAPLGRVSDEGVEFRSHYDGARMFFSPESVIDMQVRMGSDIIMPLDHCLPYPSSESETSGSVQRTLSWARASVTAKAGRPGALYGIVQGGVFGDLRARCAAELAGMELDGFAVGGVCVGEPAESTRDVLSHTIPMLPEGKPRYVMGMGPPADLLACIGMGADMFDCVLPTRNARSGYVFTRRGVVRLKNASNAKSRDPIDPDCGCETCRSYSRAYLRHLFNVGEILGMTLATIHNVAFFEDLMAAARTAIIEGRYAEFAACGIDGG